MADDYEYFGGNTQYDDAYYIAGTSGLGLTRGRLEVCRNASQTWGVVCDETWTNLDASVACRQIGFSHYGILVLVGVNSLAIVIMNHLQHPRAGAIAISEGSMFLESSRDIVLYRPECLGNESMLTACSQPNPFTCTAQQPVGVACQGQEPY